MNRAFGAVFHFRDEFSRRSPVDALCIEWKTGTGFLIRTGSPQQYVAWSGGFVHR